MKQLMENSDYIQYLKGCRKSHLIKLIEEEFNQNLEKINYNSLTDSNAIRWSLVIMNASKISQAPELKHFIRVGEKGEVLEKPAMYEHFLGFNREVVNKDHIREAHHETYDECIAWEKAENDLLFEGATIERQNINLHAYWYALMYKGKVIAATRETVQGEAESTEFMFQHYTIEDILIATK